MSRDAARDHGRSEGSRPSTLETTSHLIQRARAGDQEAMERLFARHLKPLQRWARGRLPKWARDLADTDDLVQDTLVQTFRRLENFEPRRAGALQAYLRRAVLNRVRNELRRKGREPQATDRRSWDVEREIGEVQLFSGRYAAAVGTFDRITDAEPDRAARSRCAMDSARM